MTNKKGRGGLFFWNETNYLCLTELSWVPFSTYGFLNKGIWLFCFWSQIKKMRYSEFSAYKLHICRWRNKCDQVLLRQLVLGLIGAVQNLSPSAVHNLSAKMAPSQKHICHYSVGAGEGAMLQSRICHDGGGGGGIAILSLITFISSTYQAGGQTVYQSIRRYLFPDQRSFARWSILCWTWSAISWLILSHQIL